MLRRVTSHSKRAPPQSRLWRFSYFTNADRVKGDDPYATLGLQWGDGATLHDIKTAYRKMAARLHPDVVTPAGNKQLAAKQFQNVKDAYEKLTKFHSSFDTNGGNHEEWSASVYRNGDRIAVNRTDVAGARKKRPIPAVSTSLDGSSYALGTSARTRGEFLGEAFAKTSASVGRGQNKWVQPKSYTPWEPNV